MKPTDQTKLHVPGKQNGNCMCAALASLLEIDIENVPCFEDMSSNKWYFALLDWLKSLGFHLLRWDIKEKMFYLPGFFIANGLSPRGFQHSVIYRGTEMVHDPHPSRDGIKNITSVWVLLPLDPMQQLRSFREKKL